MYLFQNHQVNLNNFSHLYIHKITFYNLLTIYFLISIYVIIFYLQNMLFIDLIKFVHATTFLIFHDAKRCKK